MDRHRTYSHCPLFLPTGFFFFTIQHPTYTTFYFLSFLSTSMSSCYTCYSPLQRTRTETVEVNKEPKRKPTGGNNATSVKTSSTREKRERRNELSIVHSRFSVYPFTYGTHVSFHTEVMHTQRAKRKRKGCENKYDSSCLIRKRSEKLKCRILK